MKLECIDNIFFDFNGTLLDDLDLSFKLEQEILEKLNMPLISKEFYLDHFAFPVKRYYEFIGFPTERYEEIASYFIDEYSRRASQETSIFEGTKETLNRLKKSGYKLFILSASEINLLEAQLKDLGIYEYFNGIAGCENIHAHGKIEYGNEFIVKKNINRDKTIMIGDTLHDFEVASKLGLKSLLFSKGHNSLKRLKECGVPIVSSYKEIENYLIK